MKLGLMSGDLVPSSELPTLGFDAVQMFYGGDDEDKDPSLDSIDALLGPGNLALAAMTLHNDLVGADGKIDSDVDRAIQCVEKTAALAGRFGDNERPILVWHPSGYPEGEFIDDHVIFEGLCDALRAVCRVADRLDVSIAVEITRAGSVGGAEAFLRIRDQVTSDRLGVCIDAANFAPDRTPLERSVRMLRSHIVIAHAKDSSFADNGEVAEYGPVGTGKLDYPTYIKSLAKYCNVPYLVFEYYKSREQLLEARDIVKTCL